ERLLGRADGGIERALDVAANEAARIGLVMNGEPVLVLHVDGAIDVEQRDLRRGPRQLRTGDAGRGAQQAGMGEHRQHAAHEARIGADAAGDHLGGQPLATEALDQRQRMHGDGKAGGAAHLLYLYPIQVQGSRAKRSDGAQGAACTSDMRSSTGSERRDGFAAIYTLCSARKGRASSPAIALSMAAP